MKVRLTAFPMVYFTARCAKHDCWVEIRPQSSTDRTDQHVIGGYFAALICKVGGKASTSSCVDSWEMAVSSAGPTVTVEK